MTAEDRDTANISIVRGRLDSIAREMSWVLKRTAFSPILWDGQDFSCALFDARARLLTLATNVPLHIVPIVEEVKNLVEKFGTDIREGDLFLQNDPYCGGTHLPDVNLIVPVFLDGILRFFSCARAHWGDIGGMTGGSISGSVTSIHQEGLRFPLLRVGQDYAFSDEWLSFINANTRSSDQRLGDLNAQLAACRTGAHRLSQMVSRYGPSDFNAYLELILQETEEFYREKMKELPRGTFAYEDYLDNDGVVPDAVRLRASVTIGEDEATVDFTGSSPQSHGPINCSVAAVKTAAFLAVKAALSPQGPINEGLFPVIKIVAPSGSVMNPEPPAPTGGFTEVLYAMTNVVSGAIARAKPASVAAADTKTANHHFFTCLEGTSTSSLYYDYPPGGCGATASGDGLDFTKSMASGVLYAQSLEVIERDGCLKFRQHTLRPGSGGAGRFRGGRGVVREIEILAPKASLSVLGDGAVVPAFGLAGGLSGARSRWTFLRENETKPLSLFGAKLTNLTLQRGDRICVETSGGGGYGEPGLRDSGLIESEIAEGLLERETARKIYGYGIAEADTPREALMFRIEKSEREAPPRGIRPLYLADTNNFNSDDLVEILVDGAMTALRARIVLRSCLQNGEAQLDSEGISTLGVETGTRVQIRSI